MKALLKTHLWATAAAALALTLLAACTQAGGSTAGTGRHADALTEVVTPKGTANQTVRHKAITIYFNSQYRIPNCVAYELTAAQVAQCDAPGAEKRKNYDFAADPDVAYSPEKSDYTHSGYDRGHMAPANDFKWDRTAMTECFYMTNMCPQAHELNNGAWKKVENLVHGWARQYGRVVVVTGPVMSRGMERIGRRAEIAVPGRFFKVVLAPEQRKAIAFVYDNAEARSGLRRHVTTVRQVEQITGLDFFSSLPDNEENEVETHTNASEWLNN